MIEIIAISVLFLTIAAILVALVVMMNTMKDMVASHKEIIELAMADRIAVLDRVRAKQEDRRASEPRKPKTPQRPFAGEGNIRLRPVQADN